MIMVCLGRPEEAGQGNELHRLLSTVLSEELTPAEKKKIMKEEFDIVTTVELEGGLAKMCNLSDYIEEKGIEKGIEQGLSALIRTLKTFVDDREDLYQAVIRNEEYKNIPREKVYKYLQ